MEEENKKIEKKDKEKNNNNKIIIPIIIAVSIIALVIIVLFIIKPFNKNGGENPGNDNGDTTVVIDEKLTIGTYKNAQIISVSKIYETGDTYNIFTYECKTANCELFATKNGMLLYDEEVVKYRTFTEDEINKFNEENPNVIPESLNIDGFKEIKETATFDNIKVENNNTKIAIYMIDGNAYVKMNDNMNNEGQIKDNMLFTDSIIYDIKKKDIVYNRDEGKVISIEKNDDLYIIKTSIQNGAKYIDEVFNKEFDLLSKNNPDKYYVNNNEVYYIENGKIMVVNQKNKIKEYDNSIQTLALVEDKILYLDKDNNIMMKKLKDNKVFFESDIKMENAESYIYMQIVDDMYVITYNDYSVVKDEGFDKYIRGLTTDEEAINTIKKCGLKDPSCNAVIPILGYQIKIDKNGKLIAKDYIFFG